jgi:hypothetical protein
VISECQQHNRRAARNGLRESLCHGLDGHFAISMLSQKLRNAIFQFRGWERRRKICNAMLLDIAFKFRKPFRWHRCKTLFGSGRDTLMYPSARARNLSLVI